MPKPRVKMSWTAKTPKKILSMRESRIARPLRPRGVGRLALPGLRRGRASD